MGYTLDEIVNDITKATPACFEPTIDYCVVKVPRFAFEKFKGTDPTLTTRMKAVGEIMAIGRTFEEAFGKAMRSLEDGHQGICAGGKEGADKLSDDELAQAVGTPTEHRIFFVVEALRRGWDVARIHAICGIDPWYLNRINDMVQVQESIRDLRVEDIDADAMRLLKQYGTSDAEIAALTGSDERFVRAYRKGLGVVPSMKTVDTCAAEFSSATEYHYKTYENIYRTSPDAKKCVAPDETTPADKPKAMILGAGPNRIGQGIEFDYCCVHASYALSARGFETIMVNCNPETVSTDYDTSDRLYFEPLTYEDVMDVIDVERPDGVVVTLGGQTPLKLARMLEESGVNIMGTKPDAIDFAEDRERFAALLDKLGIMYPPAGQATSFEEAEAVAAHIGYPLLVRPSYVLGGRAMQIVSNEEALRHYLQTAVEVNDDSPVLVDKYIMGKELEVDAICDGRDVFIPGIMEHVERTGIHSGDSISVYPTFSVSPKVKEKIIDYTVKLGLEIGIVGLYNIQFICDGHDEVYVIEVNPRSSRTVPFLSKATGVQMADIATQVILGHSLREQGITEVYGREKQRWFVKAPAFSFSKIRGVESYLSPEMKSTGEAIGYDDKLTRALYKALQASGMKVANYGTVLLTIADKDKEEVLPLARRFYNLGFNIEATSGTADFLRRHGLRTRLRRKLCEGSSEIIDSLRQGHVSYIINTIDLDQHNTRFDGYEIRRTAVENNVTLFTSLETVKVLLDVLEEITLSVSTIDAK